MCQKTDRDCVSAVQGCHDAVEEALKKNLLWVIVAAVVIAFLQVSKFIRIQRVCVCVCDHGAEYSSESRTHVTCRKKAVL